MLWYHIDNNNGQKAILWPQNSTIVQESNSILPKSQNGRRKALLNFAHKLAGKLTHSFHQGFVHPTMKKRSNEKLTPTRSQRFLRHILLWNFRHKKRWYESLYSTLIYNRVGKPNQKPIFLQAVCMRIGLDHKSTVLKRYSKLGQWRPMYHVSVNCMEGDGGGTTEKWNISNAQEMSVE